MSAYGMSTWLPCEKALPVEDALIRFQETVWDNRRARKKGAKAKWFGKRSIIAEVIGPGARAGFIDVRVKDSTILEDKTGGRWMHAAKPGETLTFSIEKLLAYGRPERMAWTDEAARAAVIRSNRARAITELDLVRAFVRALGWAGPDDHSGPRALHKPS
jgi:hypothetical protein